MAGVSGPGSSPKFGGYTDLSQKPLPKTPDSASDSSTRANPPSAPPSPPPKSRPQWAPQRPATSSKALPSVPPKDEQEQTGTQPLDRQPTTSDASVTSAIASQSKPNIPGLRSRPSWLDQPYERPSGNTPGRELRESVSMSALKPQRSDSIKGVRTTQTDGPTGSGAAEKKLRKMQSIRQLSKSASTLFRKGGPSSPDQPPIKTTAVSDKDPETLATLGDLQKMGQDRKEESARLLKDGAVREAAKQQVIEAKINKLIDDAIEENGTKLKKLSSGAYTARFQRAVTGNLEKLQEREGFTRAQWRDKVLLKHSMPKVTEDDLASFLSTPQARGATERAARPAMEPGSLRAKDPFDTSDAALEEFGNVQDQKTAAKAAAMKEAAKEEAGVEAEAVEAARRRKKDGTSAS